jgi:hypothetical protein
MCMDGCVSQVDIVTLTSPSAAKAWVARAGGARCSVLLCSALLHPAPAAVVLSNRYNMYVMFRV